MAEPITPDQAARLTAAFERMLVETTRPRPEVARREQELLAFAAEVHGVVPHELARAIQVAVDNDEAAWALERQLWTLRVAKAERRADEHLRNWQKAIEEVDRRAVRIRELEARVDELQRALDAGDPWEGIDTSKLRVAPPAEPLGPYDVGGTDS